MIDISVKDLVKSFDEDENLLDGISFDVQSGERVGLLGKNGAGNNQDGWKASLLQNRHCSRLLQTL